MLVRHDPAMPSKADMLRCVAADPVSKAVFSNTMMLLFLRHVVGVEVRSGRFLKVDGGASALFIGVFGVVVFCVRVHRDTGACGAAFSHAFMDCSSDHRDAS